MKSIDELTQPLTKDQIKDSIYEALGIVGVSTTSWKTGAVVRTMIVVLSIVSSAFSELMAAIAKSGFLDTAEGPWLKAVAKYVFGVDAIDATFAPGEVTLTNSGGGIYDFDADELVFVYSAKNKSYRNTSPFHLAANSAVTIPILAVEAGSDSTAPPGAIDTLETAIVGLTCSNALALVGEDAEDDVSLRLRCEEKRKPFSPNGARDAMPYAARTATRADGSWIGVTRVRAFDDGQGNVNVYCATAAGPVTGTQDDASTDLGAIHDRIQKNAVPLAVTEYTHSAEPVVCRSRTPCGCTTAPG